MQSSFDMFNICNVSDNPNVLEWSHTLHRARSTRHFETSKIQERKQRIRYNVWKIIDWLQLKLVLDCSTYACCVRSKTMLKAANHRSNPCRKEFTTYPKLLSPSLSPSLSELTSQLRCNGLLDRVQQNLKVLRLLLSLLRLSLLHSQSIHNRFKPVLATCGNSTRATRSKACNPSTRFLNHLLHLDGGGSCCSEDSRLIIAEKWCFGGLGCGGAGGFVELEEDLH